MSTSGHYSYNAPLSLQNGKPYKKWNTVYIQYIHLASWQNVCKILVGARSYIWKIPQKWEKII